MTDLTKRNIISFWKELAEADLGSAVHVRAQELSDFFTELLSNEADCWYNSYGEKEYAASSFTRESRMAAYLRAFQMSSGLYSEDGFTLSICINLHSVVISESVVQRFQNWMIYQLPEPPTFENDATYNWLWRYQNLHR